MAGYGFYSIIMLVTTQKQFQSSAVTKVVYYTSNLPLL